jgi:hypothetical protein
MFKYLDHYADGKGASSARNIALRSDEYLSHKRETYAESPVKMTLSFRPDIPIEVPAESTSNRYTSNASSIAKGYGSGYIRLMPKRSLRRQRIRLPTFRSLPVLDREYRLASLGRPYV